MKITTDTVGRFKIDIHVDNSGMFNAEFNDEDYSAATRVELLEKLKKAVKAAGNEKAIPVSIVNFVPATRNSYSSNGYEIGRGVVHAKLRGKHGREWNAFLFASEDGKKFKVTKHEGLNGLCRRLTDDEIAEYNRLAKAVDDAEAAFKAWLDVVAIDPAEALGEQ